MGNYSQWKIVARSGWRGWMHDHELDDGVSRPTERRALIHLEAQARAGDSVYDLPLTPLEKTVYTLEREYMAAYRAGMFIKRHGILSTGQKYAWIAYSRPELQLTAYEVRQILEEVSAVMEAFYHQIAVERILGLEPGLEKQRQR